MPKYSVLVPTYNEENYIGKLLTCLYSQTFKDFEVIIVDAPSQDNTKEEVLKFKDKLNLQFLVSPARGVSQQRNFAASKASTNLFLFFDADVLPEVTFIEKINKVYEEKKPDVLTCWNVPISDKKRDKFFYWVFDQMYLEPLKNKAPVAVGTFIFTTKEAFNAVGGFVNTHNLAEDFELVRNIFKAGFKYVLLKDPKIEVSVRRMDKEGRVSFVWKQLRAGFLVSIKGFDSIQGKFKHEFGDHLKNS